MYDCLMGINITTFGEILIDLTQDAVDGNGVVHFAANPGGAPANVAVVASRLGAVSGFVGCIGKDNFGDILRKTLVDNNVDISGLQVTSDATTTLAVVMVDGKGERSFSFCRNPGADTIIDGNRAMEAVRGSGIVHFGSVSLAAENCRSTIIDVVRHARESGSLISYDPNYRPTLWKSEADAEKWMRAVLPLCDLVKISEEETLLITGKQGCEEAAQTLIESGVRLVLVTLGGNGAYWRYGNLSGYVPGFKVKVADTNGAGDTFFGAFLSRIAARGGIDGLTADEINCYVKFANKAASITTSRPGAIPAMPTLDEVNREME